MASPLAHECLDLGARMDRMVSWSTKFISLHRMWSIRPAKSWMSPGKTQALPKTTTFRDLRTFCPPEPSGHLLHRCLRGKFTLPRRWLRRGRLKFKRFETLAQTSNRDIHKEWRNDLKLSYALVLLALTEAWGMISCLCSRDPKGSQGVIRSGDGGAALHTYKPAAYHRARGDLGSLVRKSLFSYYLIPNSISFSITYF